MDSAFVAGVAMALSHTEGLKAVTFNRVKEATDKDPQLVQSA